MDTFYSRIHADFFGSSLALCNHASYHKKRNPQLEMDSAGLFAAHLHGISVVFSCHLYVLRILLRVLFRWLIHQIDSHTDQYQGSENLPPFGLAFFPKNQSG